MYPTGFRGVVESLYMGEFKKLASNLKVVPHEQWIDPNRRHKLRDMAIAAFKDVASNMMVDDVKLARYVRGMAPHLLEEPFKGVFLIRYLIADMPKATPEIWSMTLEYWRERFQNGDALTYNHG